MTLVKEKNSTTLTQLWQITSIDSYMNGCLRFMMQTSRVITYIINDARSGEFDDCPVM